MKKTERSILCPRCLKKVRAIDKEHQRKYRADKKKREANDLKEIDKLFEKHDAKVMDYKVYKKLTKKK